MTKSGPPGREAAGFRDLPPRSGGGIRARDSAPAESRLRDQQKCTESVSPPSSSPDRPPPKRLPGGRAFNLRRSVLGALGNLPADLAFVKHSCDQLCRKLRQSRWDQNSRCSCDRECERLQWMCSAREGGDPSAGFRVCGILPANKRKRTEAVAPSSGFPTDRRRSDCLSEGHQPQALRPRCTWDTTARFTPRQVGTDPRNPQFATFSLQTAQDCVSPPVLYLKRTKKFAEPGALSSTSPADLPLPRTASREGFVLVASRARRSGNLRLRAGPCKGICRRKPRKLRTSEVR